MDRGKGAGLSGFLDFNQESIVGVAWDSGTAYTVGDAVTLSSLTYVAIAASTNQTPPNATYWKSVGPFAYTASVTAWGKNLAARPIERTGPGSNGLPDFRLADVRGGGEATATFEFTGPPLPSQIKYASGTMKLTYSLDHNDYISFPVRMSNISFTHVEEGEGADEVWHAKFTWVLNGAVTMVWQGTQIAFSAPSADDKETYEGMQKIYDANGLLVRATQRIDVQGIVDTDAAWQTKLAAWVAAAVTPPLDDLKVVTATMVRNSDDSTGGQIIVVWAPSDSKDEIELGESYSVRRYATPGEDVVVTVEDTTSTARTYIDTLTGAFFAEDNAADIQARKANPNKAVVRRIYKGLNSGDVGTGIVVAGETHLLRSHRLARKWDAGGSFETSLFLYVKGSQKQATGKYKVTFGTEIADFPVRNFSLRRIYEGLPIDDKASTVGKLNNATWNGLAAYTVMYMGASFSVSSNKTQIDYNFQWRKEPNLKLSGEEAYAIIGTDETLGWRSVQTLQSDGVQIVVEGETADFSAIFSY